MVFTMQSIVLLAILSLLTPSFVDALSSENIDLDIKDDQQREASSLTEAEDDLTGKWFDGDDIVYLKQDGDQLEMKFVKVTDQAKRLSNKEDGKLRFKGQRVRSGATGQLYLYPKECPEPAIQEVRVYIEVVNAGDRFRRKMIIFNWKNYYKWTFIDGKCAPVLTPINYLLPYDIQDRTWHSSIKKKQ